MPFYLFQGRYSQASFRSLIENPRDREADVKKMMAGMGVTLHHLFFAFGENDAVVLLEAASDTEAAAALMAVAASGSMSGGATTKLMTSGEAMAAMQMAKAKGGQYKAPAG
jgi:uncharacterized protein with GYD domain